MPIGETMPNPVMTTSELMRIDAVSRDANFDEAKLSSVVVAVSSLKERRCAESPRLSEPRT
jgi:hypothetical protein